ncbi:MAG: hypothetical protein CL782_06500 [Chloroflexi bacterium]|nr:hypothetical protein [Chloroflexota bacterium]|tara:strand:- start:160 stop:729 length:570 start_codon:yes stop_codon:yes gene_type:complete
MKKPPEIFNIIKNRRNTKIFEDKAINNIQIETLLESAIWAPNHRNTEPWRFYVVGKNSPARNKISEGMIALQEQNLEKKLSQDQENKIYNQIDSSPLLIFVYSLIGINDEITEENYGAVCCAIQNIQLTATGMGLGVGWSTGKICKISNLNKIFGITEQLKIAGVLSVGYPKSNSIKTRKNFKSLTTWL